MDIIDNIEYKVTIGRYEDGNLIIIRETTARPRITPRHIIWFENGKKLDNVVGFVEKRSHMYEYLGN